VKAHDESGPDETIRQQLRQALTGRTLSAKELSGLLSVPEKDVHGHLEHLRRSLQPSARGLVIIPARCRKCGFVFEKREKLKKPGRCPRCRETLISEPLFTIS
jgi:transcriptional regulator